MFVLPPGSLISHTDGHRSMSSMTTASPRRRDLLKNKRMLRRKKRQTQQLPRPKKQKPRFKRKSKRCSAKLQPQSHSCQCLMATAHSTSWSTQMPTATCPWNGATAMRKKSRTPRRFSSGASQQTVTALTRWSHTGTLEPIAILCGSPNADELTDLENSPFSSHFSYVWAIGFGVWSRRINPVYMHMIFRRMWPCETTRAFNELFLHPKIPFCIIVSQNAIYVYIHRMMGCFGP